MANVDCSRVRALIVEINRTQQEIPKIIKDLDDLGFGTRKTAAIIRASYRLAVLLDKLPPIVWKVLAKFVRCQDEALADLAVDELKLLVEVLYAQAQLHLEGVEDPDLRADMQLWAGEIKRVLDNWVNFGTKDDIVDAIQKLKRFVKRIVRNNAPWILNLLVELFGDQVLEAVEKGLAEQIKKTLIKHIINRIVEEAVGKQVAKKLAPWIGATMTGWDLLIEMAAGSAVKDLQEYVDKLLAELVKLMVQCKYPWPSGGNTLRFKGQVWVGVTATARPFVRCAKIVNGKPVWGAPCQVKYLNADGTTASSRTVTWKAGDINPDGSYRIHDVRVDMNSVNACTMGAQLCYYYDEVTFVLPNGKRTVVAYISGATKMP